MKSGKCIYIIIAIAVLLSVTFPAGAWASTRIETMNSTAAEGPYWIYIYLPDDYDSTNRRYSVVYLLDADLHFDRLVETICSRNGGDMACRAIIVGIGYGNQDNRRWHDYTPSAMADFPGSGGVSQYYRFLRKELIPYIDRHYRTVRRAEGRCIAGHSFGGIAAYYGMIFNHDLFEKYIVISPSLWWDNELFFKKRMRFHPRGLKRPLQVYCAVGSLEDSSMDILAVKYLQILKSRHPKTFKSRYAIIDGRDHEDVVNDALADGLDFIFR